MALERLTTHPGAADHRPPHHRFKEEHTMASTPTRPIRISDELWDAVKAKAAERGEVPSAIIRDMLTDYVGDRRPGYTTGVKDGRKEILDRLTTKPA